MPTAKVLQPISHLGRYYERGETIEVDYGTAHQLVAAGVIAIAVSPSPAASAVQERPAAPKFKGG